MFASTLVALSVMLAPPQLHARLTASTYPQTILADSPLMYYRLGEASGTAAVDASPNARNGTYQGGTTLGVSGAIPGDSDTALKLDGGSGIVALPSSPASVTGSFTVEAWVNPTDTGTRAIFGSRGPNDASFDLKLMNGNLIRADVGDGSSWLATNADTAVSYTPGIWHLIDFTVTPGTYQVYMDGALVGGSSLPTGTPLLWDANHSPRFGSSGSSVGEYFSGSMDETAIYPTALSGAQVAGHFTASGITTPTAPGSVTATASANAATVTWTASTASVPAGCTAVQRYIVTAYKGTTAVNAVAVDATATSAVLSGLQGGVAYTFKVSGVNAYGVGTPGTSAAVTPTGTASTYASTVLGDTPSVYYRLDDPSGGVAADSSGH
ncbi:MAG: LamG-like jellyroll fold domain-containing protein, partial [Candidatus Dormibacteria bacterium]